RLSAAVEVPAEAVARAAAAEARRRAGGERGRPARDGAVREREAHARRLRGHAAVLAGGEGLELARRDRRAVEANGERARVDGALGVEPDADRRARHDRAGDRRRRDEPERAGRGVRARRWRGTKGVEEETREDRAEGETEDHRAPPRRGWVAAAALVYRRGAPRRQGGDWRCGRIGAALARHPVGCTAAYRSASATFSRIGRRVISRAQRGRGGAPPRRGVRRLRGRAAMPRARGALTARRVRSCRRSGTPTSRKASASRPVR